MALIIKTLTYVVYIAAAYFLVRMIINFFTVKKNKKLLEEGKFEEVIKIYEKLHNKYSKYNNYKGLYFFNIAKCYYRLGNFKKSNEILKEFRIDELDKNYKVMYYGIYASNLALMEKDLETAYNYIKLARKIYELPEMILNQAIIERIKGIEDAEKTFEEFKDKVMNAKGSGEYDSFGKEILENYLIGLYHYKSGNMESAKDYFEKTSRLPYKNYFSDTAKEFLKKIN